VISKEPVLTATSVLAVIGAVLGYLVSAGVLSDTQASSMTQLFAVLVPLVLPLLAGLWARRKVTPVPKAVDEAMDRHPAGTQT
jgi:hypothetical protein